MLAVVLFSGFISGVHAVRLTKRAPDAGDSAQISSNFLRLVIFLVGRLRRPRPSAGNANRWQEPCFVLKKQSSFINIAGFKS